MTDIAAAIAQMRARPVPPGSPAPKPEPGPEPAPHPAHRALVAATDGVLREVVEHHKPDPAMSHWDKGRVAYWRCRGCDPGSHAEDMADWPCSTTELIAERLGVPLDERHYTVDQPEATA